MIFDKKNEVKMGVSWATIYSLLKGHYYEKHVCINVYISKGINTPQRAILPDGLCQQAQLGRLPILQHQQLKNAK